MRIPVEYVSRGYIDIPAYTTKKGYELAEKFVKNISGNIVATDVKTVSRTVKVIADTSLLYPEDICENWAKAQTEDVVIFNIYKDGDKSYISVVAVIEELNEKLTLVEFGYNGWIMADEDVKSIKTEGIFAVLDRIRSENRRIYSQPDSNAFDVFISAATRYVATLDEVDDKEELYNYLKINQLKCLIKWNKSSQYFMLRIEKEV